MLEMPANPHRAEKASLRKTRKEIKDPLLPALNRAGMNRIALPPIPESAATYRPTRTQTTLIRTLTVTQTKTGLRFPMATGECDRLADFHSCAQYPPELQAARKLLAAFLCPFRVFL